MYLSFPALPSLRTNVPAFFSEAGQVFNTFTSYLLENGQKLAQNGSSLLGRVNLKTAAFPLVFVIAAVTACIFYISNKDKSDTINKLNTQLKTAKSSPPSQVSGLREEVNQKAREVIALDAIIFGLKKDIELAEKRVKTAQGLVRNEQKTVSDLQANKTTLETNFEKVQTENASLQTELKNLTELLEETKAAKETLSTELAQLKTDVETKASEAGSSSFAAVKGGGTDWKKKYATTNSSLTTAKADLQRSETANSELQQELSELQEKYDALEKEKTQLYVDCTEKAKEYLAEIESLKAQLSQEESF